MSASGAGGSALTLVVLVLLAFAVRAAWLGLTFSSPLVSDELFYFRYAADVAREGDLVGGVRERAPLFPWACAAWFAAFGVSPAVRWLNVVFGALAVLPTFLLARRLGGQRAGLLAAAAAALEPTLVTYGGLLLTEPLYLLLEVSALAVLAGCDRRRLWRLVPAGLLLGLAALTREVGLILLCACAVWAAWFLRPTSTGRMWAPALLLVAAGVVIGPWSAIKSARDGAFVLVSRTNWLNLYLAHCVPELPYAEGYLRYALLGPDEVERERAARAAVTTTLLEEPWRDKVRHAARQSHLLFAPESIASRRLTGGGEAAYRFGWDVLDTPAVRQILSQGITGASLVVLLWGAAALPLAGSRAQRLLLAAAIAAHWLGPVLAFGASRFRLPIVPVVLASGAVLAADRRAWRAASPVAKAAGLLGAGLLGWWACWA